MGSTLVTNGKIRSMPSTDAYRNGYQRIEENNKLIAMAEAELEELGLVSLTTLSDLAAAGFDISQYN